jgi:hypothetical protein
MGGAGVDPAEHAIDRLRVRANAPGAYRDPAAAAAYVAHRDTWYANPRAQINWWIPLHDVAPDETFVIYPDRFDRPIANSSAALDYDAWIRRVGWQSARRDPDAAYPAALADLASEPRRPVSCGEGEIVLFSAAHLHQSLGMDGALARFSVDFRTVHLGDHARGLGAPNVDDASTGSALADYVHPERRS